MNTAFHHSNDDAITPVRMAADGAKTAAMAVPSAIRWLALGAVAGPVLLTVAWVVLGFISPGYTAWGIRFAPYSPITQPISGLGLGPTAPFMNAAFILYGLFLLVGVVGIVQVMRGSGVVAQWGCGVLLALSGVGAVIDGIFTLQSFLPHFVGFGLGCGTPVLSFLATGVLLRRVPRLRRFGGWLLLASPLTLVLLVLSQATFDQSSIISRQGVAGLTERILIFEVCVWFAALGWLAFRRS